ncbi:polycystin-1-like isoform X2, partial [Brachionus plicatilis]
AYPTSIQIKTDGQQLGNTVVDVSNLQKIQTSNTVGYVIPVDKNLLPSTRSQFEVVIKNAVFSRTFKANISLYSSIRDLNLLTPESVILLNTDHQFSVNYKSLGTPSCSAVEYTNSALGYSIGSFGDAALCANLFPSTKYIQAYDLSVPGSWTFVAKFSTTGNLKLTINVKNQHESLSISEYISVVPSLGQCELPRVDIINKASLFYEPQRHKISDLLYLLTDTRVNCSTNSRNVKEWQIYTVDKKSGSIGQLVYLADNPTVNYAELVIQPNTLALGLYKIIYRVSMLFNSVYTSQSETFIEIVPSGIVISSLVGQFGDGIYEIARGINQPIVLNPVMYSVDLDGKARMSSLRFIYFCKVIENEIELDYARLGASAMTDLLTIKTFYHTQSDIKSLVYNNSKSCFQSADSFEFDSTGNVMSVRAKGLEYVKNRKYEILIKTNHLGYEYSSKIRIEILNYNFVPIISIKCKFLGTCWSYEDKVKINPNTRLILVSSCHGGCSFQDNITRIDYQFRIYKYWNFTAKDNDLEEKWVPYYNYTHLRSRYLCVSISRDLIQQKTKKRNV